MDFSALHVRNIVQTSDGEYSVTVGFASAQFIGASSQSPPEDESVTLRAPSDEIKRLDGLIANETEIAAWLDGADWHQADLARYLKSRIRHG